MATEKFCTRCGKKFFAVGREVICPACKAQAAEDAKKAAVLKAKRASWTGESVPVRISGRASTVIREYGAANGLPFAAALDALLKASDYFGGMQMAWDDITPYRSHRRDKATSAQAAPDAPDAPDKPQGSPEALDVTIKPQDVPQAAKASTASTAKASKAKASTASTAKASKTTSKAKAASKTSKTSK